jgi:NAD(P)-dependent dehydrogenase (short-subunit alcohol dehydrogenase family)
MDTPSVSPHDNFQDVDERFQIKNDIAIVTGAGGGIGRAISFVFADAGADVILVDREEEALRTIADEIQKVYSKNPCFFPTDITDPDALEEMIDAIDTNYNNIDILANVAGVSIQGPTASFDIEEWKLVQQVNLTGTFLCCQKTFPLLRNGGRIINISSMAGLYGAATMSPYAAAKAGVVIFTRSLSNEWAEHGIRVNAIAPGTILTPAVEDLYSRGKSAAFDRKQVHREIGSPAEIADAALFLAAPASSFVTGETLVVEGPPPVEENFAPL